MIYQVEAILNERVHLTGLIKLVCYLLIALHLANYLIVAIQN